MSLAIVKAKKKVSCVVCRLAKVKCCGGQPCQRCSSRKIQNQCTYLKPGQVGRPAKNSVINRLVHNRTKQLPSNSFFTEFIFENVGYSIPSNSKFINDDSTKNLYYFIDTFFNHDEAIMQLAVIRITKAIPHLPDIKMYDLLDLFTWSFQDILNIVVSRLGTIPLDSFCYFDSIAAAVFQDLALKFFSEPFPEIPIGNPLSTLSSHQCVRLIEAFFSVSPHCILLNKTIILQGYWTESIDPLLLCVIYGTTTYMSKLLEGQPVGLWDAVTHDIRNPFLEYAYCLIQKSSSKVSLAKFQAIVILGLFESIFGFPKRGMANLGLAFLICKDLGVGDGSFQAKSNNIQAELANVAFWALFNSTIRGSVDLGHVPHFGRPDLSFDLPPPTIDQSASYQFEQSNGDARLFRSYYYLLESFYIQTVTCKFTSLILLQLPEVKYNMYHPNKRPQGRSVGLPKPDDLAPRLRTVLQEFGDFIQSAKDTWSKQQTYTLETIWTLYDIQIDFMKTIGPVLDGTNYGNTAYDFLQEVRLSPDDPTTMARVQASIFKVYSVVEKTHVFVSDPVNYNEQLNLLPRGVIVSALETAVVALLLKFSADPWDEMTFGYLKMVERLTKMNIWTDWSAISTLQTKISDFFTAHPEAPPTSTFPMTATTSTTTMKDGYQFLETSTEGLSSISSSESPSKSWGSPLDNYSTVITELSTEDELTRAAFFDPCATWLAPMTTPAMDLRLLDGIDTFPINPTSAELSTAINAWTISDSSCYDNTSKNNTMAAPDPIPTLTVDNTYLQEFLDLNTGHMDA
ncbi:hypothetical protein BCR42DRAFT_384341 [Absidia repens]|uniref:Zn(2)-C6 fungal-type domain-containing protein n=1 Tax=Absidia repens TaxID=90262 RepID=A0A1X2I0M4_9FUNG|nr:hypothetical protein BCR42DRAFT_384341 [Absidia repens]